MIQPSDPNYCLIFPFTIPGYGVIRNYSAWRLFLSTYSRLLEAHKNLTIKLDEIADMETIHDHQS